ncbi:hypothetical protein HS088_TW19G00179 [Tripterygium wilfordii]|uniref:Glabrous enhancer-binding protein-like DBD domain-containing protein n=1 Tax=Tripterygium wilfordii TaxID=458696 RepID=A0A7J7C9P8_TRIWF|nr:hypothetical protein HS088_TW19G00179 [Tripterygium wilfordii]
MMQNARQNGALEPYLKRLSSDVETQIGFFKGALHHYEVYKIYPFDNAISLRWFTKYGLQVDVSVEEVFNAAIELWLQYEHRLSDVSQKLDKYWRPDEERVFEWAHKIWGNPQGIEISESGNDNYDDDDFQGAVKKRKKNEEGSEDATLTYADIRIMTSILGFLAQRRRYPFYDENDAIDFMENWLLVRSTFDEFKKMLEKLRDRYKNAGKRPINATSFKSPKEKAYELVYKIWG